MTDPSQEPETRHLLSDEKARHDNPAVCLVKVCETPVCGSHIRIVSSQDADAIDIFDSLTQPLESKVNISRDGRGTYNDIFRLYLVRFTLEPFWAESFTVYEHAI
jgi:hypothetical protein